jgi:hypothetical protein
MRRMCKWGGKVYALKAYKKGKGICVNDSKTHDLRPQSLKHDTEILLCHSTLKYIENTLKQKSIFYWKIN